MLAVAFREVGKAVRWLSSFIDDLREFFKDWHGEEPRPDIGYAGRKGVMARLYDMEQQTKILEASLAAVHHEVVPNGGGSLRDAVNRIEATVVSS